MKSKIINDIILICVVLALMLGAIFLVKLFSEDGDMVVVILDGDEIARYPLSENREERIESENGQYNKLVIKDGKAYVEEASCHSQDCVRHASISRTDEQIVCLPHKLVVKLDGQAPVSDNSDLDIIIQ